MAQQNSTAVVHDSARLLQERLIHIQVKRINSSLHLLAQRRQLCNTRSSSRRRCFLVARGAACRGARLDFAQRRAVESMASAAAAHILQKAQVDQQLHMPVLADALHGRFSSGISHRRAGAALCQQLPVLLRQGLTQLMKIAW